MSALEDAALRVKKASLKLWSLESDAKNALLFTVAAALRNSSSLVEAANRVDLERAQSEGLEAPLLKRLQFSGTKLEEAALGLETLAALPDPVGQVQEARLLADDLELYRVAVPIGVIAMIFESRPDALVQMAGLCLKSGNGVLLKGGREALETNRALADLFIGVCRSEGVTSDWLHLAETRDDVSTMLGLDHLIDLIIPRGSNSFVRYIMEHTRIPVLGHADGLVHVYLHSDADPDTALRVTVDSKTQYVAVCNAVETLLVHQDAVERLLPPLAMALRGKNVRLKGCERTRRVVPDMEVATPEDWGTEYLDSILSVKTVASLEEAIDHINTWGSGHTDAIVTTDRTTALRFMDGVDTADVFWNASTRFADGYRYGLGAEVGISTGKLHARGPMGLQGLLTSQWRLFGKGHTVADFSEGKKFLHRDLPFHDYKKHLGGT